MTIQVRESGALKFPALSMRGNAPSQVEFDALEAEIIAAREGSASLDAKLDLMETATDTVTAEVVEARSGSVSLDARVDSIMDRTVRRLTVSGTGTAYTATCSPTLTVLNQNSLFVFNPNVSSVGTPTLAIDGFPAAPLYTVSGNPPYDGYYQTGVNYLIISQSGGASFRPVTTHPRAASITGYHIADDSITQAEIADGAVGTAQIIDANVTLAKMAANSVGTTQLVNASVTSAKLAADAVASASLADGSVTLAKMAANSVGTTQLVADSVTSAKIATGAVGSTEIVDAAVTNAKLAVNAVATTNIVNDAVTQDKLSNDTVAILDEVIAAREGSASLDARIDIVTDRTIYRLVTDGASTATAYVTTSNPPVTAPGANTLVKFQPNVTSGATATIKVDGNAPVPLLTAAGSSVTTGHFRQNVSYLLLAASGGANYRPISAALPADYIVTDHLADGAVTEDKLDPALLAGIGTDVDAAAIHRLVTDNSSTGADYVVTSDPPIAALGVNVYCDFAPNVDSEASPTLKIDEFPAKPLTSPVGGALPAGYFQSGNHYLLFMTSAGANVRPMTGIPADFSVTVNKIADGAVTTVKLADNAVRTDKIYPSNVTREKLSADIVSTLNEVTNARGGKASLDARLDSMDAGISDYTEAVDGALRAAIAVAPDRPGEEPHRFTTSILGGDIDVMPASFPTWDDDLLRPTDEGEAALLINEVRCAVRGKFPINPSKTYRLTWKLRRSTNPVDPENDAIVPGIAWYGANKEYLGLQTLTPLGVSTGDGWQTVTTTISRAAGAGITIVSPALARFVTPFVQCYGSSTQTQVLRIDHEVVEVAASPDVDALEGRVDALEAVDAEDRLDALEAASVPGAFGFLNIKDYGGVANGTIDDTLALQSVDNAGVAQGRTVLIRNGQNVRVAVNSTLSANYVFERGGKLTLDAAVTALAMNGSVVAADEIIFAGTGKVFGGSFGGQPVRIEWFGVPKDETAADVHIVEAIYAAAYAGVVLYGMPGRRYVLLSTTQRIGPTIDGTVVGGHRYIRWKDLHFHGSSVTGSTAALIDVYPDPTTPAAVLSADCAVRDQTITVVDSTNVVVGQRYCLISKALLKSYEGADYTTRKAEYVTVQAKTATTVTFMNRLRSSFTTANFASLYLATYDWHVQLDNVTIERPGGASQNGIEFTYCDIQHSQVRTYRTATFGFFFKACSFSGEVSGEFQESPAGYGISTGGCDAPKLGIITGRYMRHILTVSGDSHNSRAWLLPDGVTRAAPCGRDGYATWVHCDNSENAIFDMHVGHFGFAVGAVTGSQRLDAAASSGIKLESPDVSIGSVNIDGGDVSIPYYGKWSDEERAYYRFGSIVTRSKIGTSQGVLGAYNNDMTWNTPMDVHVDFVKGYGGSGIFLDAGYGSVGGGDVRFTFGHAIIEHNGLNQGFGISSGANGRVIASGNRLDVTNHTTATYRAVSASGTTYTTAHPGVVGAYLNIQTGNLVHVTNAASVVLAYDAIVRLGPDVTWSHPTNLLEQRQGLGYVAGSTKRQKVIISSAAQTLTPGADPETITIAAPNNITIARVYTLATTAGLVWDGAKFRITRKAATGSASIDVGPGLKTLTNGTWVEVVYDSTLPGWFVSASGTI